LYTLLQLVAVAVLLQLVAEVAVLHLVLLPLQLMLT
jgi:hypothetical protein